MNKLKPLLVTAILFILLYSGCDEDHQNELLKGTCKVEVTGFVNKTFYGKAIFDDVPTGRGHNIFFLQLKDPTLPSGKYRYVEISGSKPASGTYSIHNSDSDVYNSNTVSAYYNDSEVNENFRTTGGLFIVHWENDDLLKGWMEFTAYSDNPYTNGESRRIEIKISANFYAQNGNTGIIIN